MIAKNNKEKFITVKKLKCQLHGLALSKPTYELLTIVTGVGGPYHRRDKAFLTLSFVAKEPLLEYVHKIIEISFANAVIKLFVCNLRMFIIS